MKNFITLIFALVLALIGLLFISCQKENNEPIATDIEVAFAIQHSDLKNSEGYNLADATKIILTITNSDNSQTKYTDSEIKIEQMNGFYYTKKIVLKTGDYKLTKFIILDALNNTIFATPLEGSPAAQNVDYALPIAFSVTKDATTPVSVQVLSTENKTPADFGLNHFPIVEVKTFGFMVGVLDSETGNVLDGKISVNNCIYRYAQDLQSVLNNVIIVKDELIDYQITIDKSGYKPYTFTFTLDSLKAYENIAGNLPLLIELEERNEATVTDIDGNIYNTITIGSQVWMAENLKVTHYRNGDPIPNVTENSAWGALNTGAYCWFNNDETTYKNPYGALYNYYAVTDGRNLAPEGWHVPTGSEWAILVNYLGGESIAGGKLKEAGNLHWVCPNYGADNSSGFTSLPAGDRSSYFQFVNFGSWTHYWFSTSNSGCQMNSNDSYISSYNYDARFGFSVRCLKD